MVHQLLTGLLTYQVVFRFFEVKKGSQSRESGLFIFFPFDHLQEAAPAAASRSNDNDVTVMESRLSVVSLDWEAREAGQHAQNCIQGVLNKKMPHYAGINVIVTSS